MNLQIFKNSEMGTEIRSVIIENEPWFVAQDVTDALSLDRTQTRKLDEDEKGVRKLHTPGGVQEMTIINESGLYNLIFRSNKPEAKRFRKWVTSEVLPAIRKQGYYYNALHYIPKTNSQAINDYQALMYRELIKVENNRQRNRLAGLVEHLSQIIK